MPYQMEKPPILLVALVLGFVVLLLGIIRMNYDPIPNVQLQAIGERNNKLLHELLKEVKDAKDRGRGAQTDAQ